MNQLTLRDTVNILSVPYNTSSYPDKRCIILDLPVSSRLQQLNVLALLFSGASPVLTTWRCTWRGTSKMASELRALWDDSGWLSWPVGDQRGRCVLGALTGAPLCSSQWKKKDEATQAIICTILSASNTSLWKFLLKGFYRGRGRAGRDLKTFWRLEKIWAGEAGKRLFCMVFNAFFSLEDYGTPAGVPFLQWQYVCLCAWGLRVSATGCLCWFYGTDGACIVELRVNDTEGAGGGGWHQAREVFQGDVCGLTENECKRSVCAVWVYRLWRGVRCWLMELRAPPFSPEVELHLPFQTREIVLFSAAIKCAMYYVACLKTYTL